MTVEIPPLYRMAYRLGHHPSQIDPDVLAAYMDKVDGRNGKLPEPRRNQGPSVDRRTAILQVLASGKSRVADLCVGCNIGTVRQDLIAMKLNGVVSRVDSQNWTITARGRQLLEGMG